MKQPHFPTRLLKTFLLASFSFLLIGVKAQNNKPVYVAFTYIKTAPNKYNDYLQLTQTYTKKFQEYQLKQGAQLGWYLYQVLLPTGSEADYNVVAVNVSTDLQHLIDPALSGREILQKAIPQITTQQLDSLPLQMSASRSIVKREIYLHRSGTNESGAPAKYAMIDFMTPVSGKHADYVKMEENTFLPIHKQRMALGVLKGWRFAEKFLPIDSEDAHPYITVNFYENIDNIIDTKYDQALKKAWPTQTIPKISQTISAVKKAQKSELWKLVEFSDQNNSK